MSSNTTSIHPDNNYVVVVNTNQDIDNIVPFSVSTSIYGRQNLIIIDDSDEDDEDIVSQSVNNSIPKISNNAPYSEFNQGNEADDDMMEVNDPQGDGNNNDDEVEDEEDNSNHPDDSTTDDNVYDDDDDDELDSDSESSVVSDDAYTDSTTDSQGRFGSMQIASYRKRHFFLCNAFGCRLVLQAFQVTISLCGNDFF